MKSLTCVVARDGSVFVVDIDEHKKVGHLKDMIKEKNNVTIKCDAKDLTLYLAKKDGDWLTTGDLDMRQLKEGMVGTAIKDIMKNEMDPSYRVRNTAFGFPDEDAAADGEIHVLVDFSTQTTRNWSAENLSTADPQVQLKMWKSVVRVSSVNAGSGTALVVNRTATHLYLLTNLHLWVDEAAGDLSDDFNKEIKLYLKLHPGIKSSGKKRKAVADSNQPIRKSPRTSRRKTPNKPQVVIEQLLPDGKALEKVLKFSLDSGVCWRSSAAFDLAIFEVTASQNVQLTPCKMSTEVYPTMHVHVFGFPGVLQDLQFDHPYAIIPAEVTGLNQNQMTLSSLSAPVLSGGAILCTKRGIPVGYIGGGFDGATENKPYQSYGFTLHGIPPYLPSRLPPVDEDETKE